MKPKESSSKIGQAAEVLAELHKKEDPSTSAVYLAEADDEIRLVEVSGSIDTAGEILPFRFAANPEAGVEYPSVVVLLSPEEWERVDRGKLKLPRGWGSAKKLRKIA